ncbi:MAG: hypothetical protein IIC91_07035 [Chloroflexi bacterium]|nr:hypothetical protein [Chloroflexota bacterium]
MTLPSDPEKPTPPPAVGGIALDGDAGLRPLNEPGSESGGFGVLAWAIAATSSAVSLGGAAWCARRQAPR